MINADLIATACGDLVRFGSLEDRVDVLLEQELQQVAAGSRDWFIMPVDPSTPDLHLISSAHDGQRRGREVLTGFLGPADARLDVVPLLEGTPTEASGVRHCTRIRLADSPRGEVLARLEDALATVHGRAVRQAPQASRHVDILRDLRLCLQRGDGSQAERLFEELNRSGRLSAENLRFLKVQVLGGLQRWSELQQLPHLPELLRTRRPREVTETLLRSLWHAELSPQLASGGSARDAAVATDLVGRFGALLHVIDVPGAPASRAVVLVATLLADDQARIERLQAAAANADEHALQQRILRVEPPVAVPVAEAASGVRQLMEQGQYLAAVDAFLGGPSPADGPFALEAILEVRERAAAAVVLDLVERYLQEGSLATSRRIRTDLTELRELVQDSCASWLDWSRRAGQNEYWPSADGVARDSSASWALDDLSGHQASSVFADDLLAAWSGPNQAHVSSCLDLLCSVAAQLLAVGQAGPAEAVLLTLSEQQGLTPPVRDAYLDLLEQLLNIGPNSRRYGDLLDHALALWRRIESATNVDWALALLDVVGDSPAPDGGRRTAFAAQVMAKWPEWSGRLSPRQIVDAQAVASAMGLSVHSSPSLPDGPADQGYVWARLDNTLVGLYSLLPRAASELQARLRRLNATATVQGNGDKVATEALRRLVERADHLIVDTWHAAHAATGAIDRGRPRNRQILPRGRGITGFLRALEEELNSI